MMISILPGEFWYGGCVSWGPDFPLSSESQCILDLQPNRTPNQAMPLLLSSKGRYLWLEGCGQVEVRNGSIFCGDSAVLKEAGSCLRDAYLAASGTYFPPDGTLPGKKLFGAPIFNSWIELGFHQNQKDLLAYAEGILKAGFKPGVLMIDDGWSECYGDWTFHSGKFPDPRAMLKNLHDLGFTVMLWICPYVSPDSEAYRQALRKKLLLTDEEGRPFALRWWNGISAGLDLQKEQARAWLRSQMDQLHELGVDGFKFDGGDPFHYIGAYSDGREVDGNELCRLWAEMGRGEPYNEFRASWKAGGKGLFQRLSDKDHSWGRYGLEAIVPEILTQGILGYPFGCADMVGGGQYLNFLEQSDRLDRELFLKHAAAGCLVPALQFSAAPWRILSRKEMEIILSQIALREQLRPEWELLLLNAADTGEPVCRYMTYVFPEEPCEQITDQFMLGDRLLVAPILTKGTRQRQVYVPEGTWQQEGKTICSRGETMTLTAPEHFVMVLEKQ